MLAAALCDLVVAQRGHPETFANNVWLDVERVSGTRLKKAQKTLDNGCSSVVSLKIDKSFSCRRGRIDECGLLGVVDQVSCVDAYEEY